MNSYEARILIAAIGITLSALAACYALYRVPVDHIAADIVIALLIADITSAAFHWFEDAYLDYNIQIPVLKEIAKDNEMHHYRPRSIVMYSYLENVMYTIPMGLASALMFFGVDQCAGLVSRPLRLVLIGLFSGLTNLVHRFSHERTCERAPIITWLQAWIFVDRAEHRMHHVSEQDRKFGVFLKGANTIYDTLGIWRGLEAVIAGVLGIRPVHKVYYSTDHQHDVILSDDTICRKHSQDELARWRESLEEFHRLRAR